MILIDKMKFLGDMLIIIDKMKVKNFWMSRTINKTQEKITT
jgi:hypothetical protein